MKAIGLRWLTGDVWEAWVFSVYHQGSREECIAWFRGQGEDV